MAFIDVRLSEETERGAIGGPGFKTRVATLESGFEKRNQDWAESRGRWDISYGIQDMDEADAVLSIRELQEFFYARRGRLDGFRFKDWSDFQIGDPANPTVTNQQIGVGDGATATFQVFKRYSSGGQDHDRTVKKLVAGTVTVLIDGVVDGTAAVNVDTGVVTPTTVPLTAELVQVACEFDVPVRFDSDQLDVRVELFNVASIPRIELVELRLR